MNFDVKLNTLAKELIGKVFGKLNSSMLQDSLNYRKHLDFPQGEHSRVKGERDTKVDYKARPIEIPDSYCLLILTLVGVVFNLQPLWI